MTFDSTSLADTARFARDFAATLRPGDCVALDGELGAGKTTFVRAVVEALGGDGSHVSSPTFVLLHVYKTPRFDVFHLDAYRVHGSDDFAAIGFDELLEQNGIVFVEWPSRVSGALPPDARRIRIEHTGESTRRFTVE